MEKYNVFISYTPYDSDAYIQAVTRVIRAFDRFPIVLDYFPPLNAETIQQSIFQIDAASIFIGIYGNHYGVIPENGVASIPEIEFDQAISKRKHHLCYLIDENYLVESTQNNHEPDRVRLKKLRAKIKTTASNVEYFTSPENLQIKLAAALRNDLKQKPHIALNIGPYKVIDVHPPEIVQNNPPLHRIQIQFDRDTKKIHRDLLLKHLSQLLAVPATEIKIVNINIEKLSVTLVLRTRPVQKLHGLAFMQQGQLPINVQPHTPVGENETILVIDDDQDLRQSLGDILDHENFHLEFAHDGLSGLSKAQQLKPDLILLDLQMPDIDGIEVLDRLKERNLNIPVILMTGHGSESVAVEVFRKGVKDYLIKPFQPEELLEAIEKRGLAEVRLRKHASQLQQRTLELNEKLQAADVTSARRLEQVRIVNQFGKSVTGLIEIGDLIEHMLGAALMTTVSEQASLYLLQNSQLFHQATLRRDNRRADKIVQLADDPVAEMVLTAGNQLIIPPEEAAKLDWRHYRNPQGVVAVPLKRAGECIGALVVRGGHAAAKLFSSFDAAMLTVLADYTTIALENASLLQELIPNLDTVFISYDRGDWQEYVSPLVKILEDAGFKLWIDQAQIRFGENWKDKVNDALRTCPIMILCISPDAMNSEDVKHEYRFFIHERKPLIPVICRSTSRLPPELLYIQYVLYDQHELLIQRLRQLMNR